jgi:hypothetical protein
MTLTATGKDLFLKAKETLASLGSGWKKLTSVTNDGGRNMYGSKTDIARHFCNEIIKMSCGNLIVFHHIIQHDAMCRNFLKYYQFQHFLEKER